MIIPEDTWDIAYGEMREWCRQSEWGLPLVREGLDEEHFLLKGVPIIRRKEDVERRKERKGCSTY
jgi:hypothetical protein